MDNKTSEAVPSKYRRYFHTENVHTKTFTPREYQVELLDAARQRNTIACLGTGTGKTFIAVMLIKELAHEVRKPYDEDGKRTFFVVPTVPLVLQQKERIQDYTDLAIGFFFGDMKVDLWCAEDWKSNFQKYNVLVMTPDILKTILLHGFLPLSKINLLIIDECHRAVKNHSYREIMLCFDTCPQKNQPRVLGLTASILNNKCKPNQLESKIRNLELTLRSKAETASDLTYLTKYGNKPKEDVVVYKPLHFSQDNEMLGLLECALSFIVGTNISVKSEFADFPHPCHMPKQYLNEICNVIMNLGPWCGKKAAEIYIAEMDCKIEQLYSDDHRNFLIMTRTVLEVVSRQCEDLCIGSDGKKLDVLENAPHKLRKLLEILSKYRITSKVDCDSDRTNNISGLETVKMSTDEPDYLCGIIFVRQRSTAHLLSMWLTEVSRSYPEYSFIVPDFVAGHNSANTDKICKDTSMAVCHQGEILKRFRDRECNLLVATAVIEEGMDVPKCNLVVRFDEPPDYRSYVQSKGRARAPNSSFKLMVSTQQKNKFLETLRDFHIIEQLVLSKCHGRECPDDEEIDEQIINKIKEPYMPVKKEGAARVTLSSAISLVNRYCAKLPSDTFTRLTPECQIVDVSADDKSPGNKQNYYQATIYLPINSPLKEPTIGDKMQSKHLAKMAAALETCRRLHEIGELDDNLLPVGKEAIKFDELLEEDEEHVSPGSARPGTTKRRQFYYKKIADVLRKSYPVPGVSCILYRFRMKLTCPIPEQQNTRGRNIPDPADTSRGFGILTTKEIPSICSFPVFTRSGEVLVELECINSDLKFSEEELDNLAFFHNYTFSNVLRLDKYPMVFQPKEADASFYIIPVNKESDEVFGVDWEFVEIINKQKGVVPHKILEEERRNYKFRTEDYRDAVVMPWYRNLDKPQFFYVAEICQELTPQSDFPDAEFETFEKYYNKKYDIKIMNLDQPLLDVDHTSARLNFLTPRYLNRKGHSLPTSSEQTKKAKRENLQQKQILIPELCIVHPFPASLWRKAVCLPCILYRVNSLLLAEQLRVRVAKEIGVGSCNFPDGFRWPTLDFGWLIPKSSETEKALTPERGTRNEQINKGSDHIDPNLITDSSDDRVSSSKLEDGDFVIDHFDPSQVHIPDDDDLAEQEMLSLNMGNVNFIGDWAPIKPSDEEITEDGSYRIRYGSPSTFEGSAWDAEWDTEIEEGEVTYLNIPGLGRISAPGMFNLKGLSCDLESCRENELWDSMDEDSLFDESEVDILEGNERMEGFSSSEKVYSDYTNTSKSSDSAWQLLQNKSDSLFVNWEIEEAQPEEEMEEEEEEELESKNQDITFELIERKEELSVLEDLDMNEEISLTDKFGKLYKMINQALVEGDAEKFNRKPPEKEIPSLSFKISEYSSPSVTQNTNQNLPFGELLPDRENRAVQEANVFRVHFDEDLQNHPGPSPSIILQGLTMSNANDGINLERLETVGDSFLKYAITAYLFCRYPNIHEGKLSFLRSKQISNLNLYRLGKRKDLGELMIATKFEPNDNWLSPCYSVPKGLEKALIDAGMMTGNLNIATLKDLTQMTEEQICESVLENKKTFENTTTVPSDVEDYIPYNLLTQQSIPDKSIADGVEALIGAYLVSCGPRAALLFMSWLGLRVLPELPKDEDDVSSIPKYGILKPPESPLLTHVPGKDEKLRVLADGYDVFEEKIGYVFKDKSYLLQAFTHASYHYNKLTDCYQRLEFLGDAVLDYLITRHLYEDQQKHTPGTLTDLRSALVNNTFFASLAVKYDFHKYFKSISHGLFSVIAKFVELKKNRTGFEYYNDYYLEEDECEEAEEVEVPKALGDIFESVAGAIYLDSEMSLDTVWKVYYAMMKPEIEYFSTHVPKSPIRELLELEPQTAKFQRAETTLKGKVRVRVEVFGKGSFVGVGRNKRIAKCTAAKRALRELKKMKKIQEEGR
ncbi:endoribonuclease Dicer-like [Limulus polyphemus]|uniref:ribonuclease III n=1 Tax=Limulus polyphemus TaxID=6850 RepID=A0ABM1T466_LIMPO|nr:endoribonuclease Dicer-like [Limulus polyphemus]XP_022250672.1 endoribonuclease Dicer-like [Limulus polyphemus]